MIERLRSKPRPLEKLEALIPRIPVHFKYLPDMQQNLAKRTSGYIGERNVDYQLQALSHKYTILRDVYLKQSKGNSFQIDTLILTPHAIFIVESKNYRRTITFDTILRQLTHDVGEVERGYRYPITQVESQKLALESWLHGHQVANIPIHYFVAIADPSTIIRVEGDKQAIANVVMHGEHVPGKLLEIDAAYAKQQNGLRIPVRKISAAILKECVDFDIDILGKYKITPEKILPGVCCPACERLGMERLHSRWECRKCGEKSKHAHLPALDAYFLLINEKITNQECMRFLKIPSRHVVSRMLKSTNLVYSPKGRYWTKKNGF